MSKWWGVNFDADVVLRYGLAEDMWLMQYQYRHGGFDYQGHAAQIAATSANLKILLGISPGDWLVAYLPRSTFYAIGEVIAPRERPRHHGVDQHHDSIDRTVQQHNHLFLDGIVRYSDSPVVYEDFTDPWRRPLTDPTGNPPDGWEYPQRIDVRAWEHVVPSGIQLGGLANATPFPTYRRAAFEIPEHFFDAIAAGLQTSVSSQVS